MDPFNVNKVDPYKMLEEAGEFLRNQISGGDSHRYFMYGGKMYDTNNLSDEDKEELKGLFGTNDRTRN